MSNYITTKKIYILIFVAVFSSMVQAYTFNEAVEVIKKHDAVELIKNKALALREQGEIKGSWGDPMLKIAAKNYPKDSLANDKTPMTGLEFSVSQKIALSSKYRNIKNAYSQLGVALNYSSQLKKQELLQRLWWALIESKKIDKQIFIYKENLSWIKNTLKVSKKLYANGKISQQALLDIQIRKSEVEASLSNKKFELKQQFTSLNYLLGMKGNVNLASVPWGMLVAKKKIQDVRELALMSKQRASESFLTARKLAYIPDITVSLGYTKRANIDDQGDFLSAAISMPLPFSSNKYAAYDQATFKKLEIIKTLADYKKSKNAKKEKIIYEVEKISAELGILKNKTIQFAENSREITTKSYRLGRSSYVELLQSELKLQKLLVKKAMLIASLAKAQVNYKFLVGEKLYE